MFNPARCAEATAHDCNARPQDSQLVIIIDDLGHHLARGRDALLLPGKLNFAVIPHTPYGAQLAESAHQNGKEVLLHAPMSTEDSIALGEGGLTADLSREEFREILSAALEQIPHVQGINNHMGSALTQQRLQMSWLMQELRKREMYFVDSRTSERTIAATVASEFNVPHLSRHVFLDNERTAEAIDARFQELLWLARRDGMAVAIGHPYPETISYLQNALLTVHEQGFRPVLVSEALGQTTEPDETSAENTEGGSEEEKTPLAEAEQAAAGGC